MKSKFTEETAREIGEVTTLKKIVKDISDGMRQGTPLPEEKISYII